MLSKKLAALAAFSMLTFSSAAVAQAPADSVSAARAGAETQDANQLGGNILIWLAILIALILGIVLLTDDDSSSNGSTSP